MNILDNAAELIKEHGWIQGGYGNDDTGYCLIGAVNASLGDAERVVEQYWSAVKALTNVLPAGLYTVVAFNDAEGRTSGEVLGLLSRASEFYERNSLGTYE